MIWLRISGLVHPWRTTTSPVNELEISYSIKQIVSLGVIFRLLLSNNVYSEFY